MEGLNAPQELIDRYRQADQFELFGCCVLAWRVVMLLSPADFHYSEHQDGKRIRLRFAGYRTPAVCAIIRAIGVKRKRQGEVLQHVRLIEYGAMQTG